MIILKVYLTLFDGKFPHRHKLKKKLQLKNTESILAEAGPQNRTTQPYLGCILVLLRRNCEN